MEGFELLGRGVTDGVSWENCKRARFVSATPCRAYLHPEQLYTNALYEELVFASRNRLQSVPYVVKTMS